MTALTEMVDRLADDITHATGFVVPEQEARRMAEGLVSDFLRREAGEETLRVHSALRDVRTLSLRGARFGSRQVPVTRGDLLDILDDWEVR